MANKHRVKRQKLYQMVRRQVEKADAADRRQALESRVTNRKRLTESELLRGIKPDMIHGEVDWGRPVGKEIL